MTGILVYDVYLDNVYFGHVFRTYTYLVSICQLLGYVHVHNERFVSLLLSHCKGNLYGMCILQYKDRKSIVALLAGLPDFEVFKKNYFCQFLSFILCTYFLSSFEYVFIL